MKNFTKAGVLLVSLMLVASLAFGAALTADRSTPRRDGTLMSIGVAVANTIYAGSMVAVDSTGYAVPASADNTLRVIGRANSQQDNSSGVAGDLNIEVGTGVFRYINNGTTISADDIGKTAYVVDDQSVDLLDNSGARPAAGRIYDVDSSGVWVMFASQGSTAATGGISLSDLAADSVNSSKIVDDSIALADMGDASVDTSNIVNSTISLEDLDSGITPSHIIVFSDSTADENDADAILTLTVTGVLATDEAWGVINTSTNPVAINNSSTSSNTVTFILNSVGGAGTSVHYWVTRAAQ